jgi:hypothetical protein
MKKLLSAITLATAGFFFVFLPGCGTISSVTGAVQTPAQLVTDICPALTAALDVLTPAQAQLTPTAQASLTKASAAKAALCSGSTAVALSDLNTIPGILAALPLIVNATKLPDQTKLDINLGLGAAKAAFDVIQAQTPTPALAPSTTKS